MATIKKAQNGVAKSSKPAPKPTAKPAAAPKPKTVSQRIGDITLRDIKNAGEDALNLSTLGMYGKAKKKVKEVTGLKAGGTIKKAKAGGSFPDLNKDGKVTKADVLKGRGVIAKNGGSVSAGTKGQSKRVGSVDPKGAYTKVQKRTLAKAKTKASLTKDKQLGATKMKNGGCMKCGGKMSKKK